MRHPGINMSNVIRVKAEELKDFCKRALVAAGMREKDAEIVADALIWANLRGVDSHGVVRLYSYIERMRRGLIDPKADPTMVRDFGAISLIDGNNGMGHVIAVHAVNIAVKKAKEYGVGVVGVRNANHIGMVAYYGIMIANNKMIGIVFSNAPPAMPPWGGKTPRLGTNPVCMAFPYKDGKHIVLDIALTVVARGKIRLAALKGEKIPEGWALDEEGKPTTDPVKALKGTLLPIGGHKGYGLAVAVDILSGVLTGSGYSIYLKALDDFSGVSKIGFYVQAINIEAFRTYEEYIRDLENLVKIIKETPKAPGVQEIYLPGEIEYNVAKERLEQGVPLDTETVENLKKVVEILGLEKPGFLGI
jgi:LDH2 family malate/lactate/ureidoglycolate dehydrogenase